MGATLHRGAGTALHRGARAFHYRGPSRCGAQAPDAQAQQLWLTGPAAPWHVGSSQTRARTRVSCISRQILNHCATREAPILFKLRIYTLFFVISFTYFILLIHFPMYLGILTVLTFFWSYQQSCFKWYFLSSFLSSFAVNDSSYIFSYLGL